MISDGARQVMRRKAGEGRAAPEMGRMTPARAWTAAVPRAAEGAAGLEAHVLSVSEDRALRDALAEESPRGALITLLEGPDERFGLAIFDAQVLGAVVEALTAGGVSARPAEPRPPTRTDAVICADLLDAVLEGFECALAGMEEPPALVGYRYAAPLVDGRAVSMTLADGPYQVFRLALDLGGGAKRGGLTLAFPVAPRGPSRRVDARAFAQALESNVMAAPARLDAVLYRTKLPVSAVAGWQPGDVVPVPLSALGTVAVEAEGGRALAEARLGQQGGFRAVRISRVGDGGGGAGARSGEFEDAVPSAMRQALPKADPRGGAVLPDADVDASDNSPPDDLPPLDRAAD